MKKNKAFLLSMAFLAVSTLAGAQSVSKENKMLKDSIARISKNLTIEQDSNRVLINENTMLRKENQTLKLVNDSLVNETERLAEENKSFADSLALNNRMNGRLESEIDSLNAQLLQCNSTMNTLLSHKKKQDRVWGRSKYFNIAFGSQYLTNNLFKDKDFYDNDITLSFTVGRTFYIPREPLFGMVKFGIDWSYLDVNFSKYEFEDIYDYDYVYDDQQDGTWNDPTYTDEDINSSYNTYKVEIGMQVGPSITVNPIDYLKVSLYFRYAPSLSIMSAFTDGETSYGYGSYFTFGLAASYKVISVGIEKRWGSCSYMYEDLNGWKTKGPKFYLSFRY